MLLYRFTLSSVGETCLSRLDRSNLLVDMVSGLASMLAHMSRAKECTCVDDNWAHSCALLPLDWAHKLSFASRAVVVRSWRTDMWCTTVSPSSAPRLQCCVEGLPGRISCVPSTVYQSEACWVSLENALHILGGKDSRSVEVHSG